MVNDAEAATVQMILQRFLRVGSMTKLVVALRSEGTRTKGGKPIDKGYVHQPSDTPPSIDDAVEVIAD